MLCSLVHAEQNLLPSFLSLKNEVASSSALPVSRYQTAWCYIPEHCNFDMYCCDNLKHHRIQTANMNRGVRKQQSNHLKYSERIQNSNII